MDLESFSKYIEMMHAQLSELDNPPKDDPDAARALLEEAATAFGTTLEEMRVAEEEIRRQNEELVETRLSSEAQRQRYQDLFDFAPDAYIVTDSHGVIREVNRAAGDLFGISPRLLAGKPLASHIPFAERPSFRLDLNRLLRQGQRHGWSLRIERRRGEPAQVVATVAVVRDWDGSPTALRWLFRETRASAPGASIDSPVPSQASELEVTEGHSPREAEIAFYRNLIRGIDLIIWEVDAPTGRYRFISPRVEEELGHSTDNWMNDPDFWLKIVHPEDRHTVRTQRERCLKTGGRREVEYRLLARDQRSIWFRESVRLDRDAEGRPSFLRGCLWNIGDRKKAERDLHIDRRHLLAQLNDLSKLQELASQLAGEVHLDEILGKILRAATLIQKTEMGIIRIFNRDGGDLELAAEVGLTTEYVAATRRIPLDVEACGIAVRRGRPVVVENVEKDPTYASWVERASLGGFRSVVSLPLVSRDGTTLGTIATFFRDPHHPQSRQMNLLEQYARLAADALENAQRHASAEGAQRRKDEFLATLAHELRSPLNVIRNSAFMIRAESADPAIIERSRDAIVRQVDHMTRLVEDLLDASRIARGSIEIRKAKVALSEIVRVVLEDVQPFLESRGHGLSVSLPESPINLIADPTRLEQILVNLITNAAKYTERGGKIELTASLDGDWLILAVRDNGIGMSPESLAHAFDLFSQGTLDPGGRGSGLGIGLALAKTLVELHGGSIQAESEGPGKGSKFTIRLPIARNESAGNRSEDQNNKFNQAHA